MNLSTAQAVFRDCGSRWAARAVRNALKNGYTLCRVQEAAKAMEKRIPPEDDGDFSVGYSLGTKAARDIMIRACLGGAEGPDAPESAKPGKTEAKGRAGPQAPEGRAAGAPAAEPEEEAHALLMRVLAEDAEKSSEEGRLIWPPSSGGGLDSEKHIKEHEGQLLGN